MIDLISRLVNVFGVSGNEEDVSLFIQNELKGKFDEIKTDALGNLICKKNGNGKKIMLTAHMDEVGIMVTHIDNNGFLRFSSIGKNHEYYKIGERVEFKNGTQGVIFHDATISNIKNLTPQNLYIDIGVDTIDEAKQLVKIGDVASLKNSFYKSQDKIISKALKSRVAIATLIEVINRLKKTDNELYFVFSTQELLEFDTIKTAVYDIRPDIAINVVVTDADDTLGNKCKRIELGKGPAIRIKDKSFISHKEVRDLLEQKAKLLNVNYQYEINDENSSDGGAIHLVAGGIKTGGISIPCRYMHTSSEMVNIKDVEIAVKILGNLFN